MPALAPRVSPPPLRSHVGAGSPSKTAPSSPQIASENPEEIWPALLSVIGNRPALHWVQSLTLTRIDGDQAHLAIQPGKRDLYRFITQDKRDQLGQLLSSIVRRTLRVQISPPSAAAESANRPTNDNKQSNIQQAMALPLVRQVMETFDASIINVKKIEEIAAESDAEAEQPLADGGIEPPDAFDPSMDELGDEE